LESSEREAALEEVHARIRICRLCALCKSRLLAVPGEGSIDAEVMFVGEGPGAEEDRQGKPFVGPSGRLLTQLLHSIGVDRRKVFITSLVKCRPPRNREPRPEEIAACRPYLLSQIRLIAPEVICALGRLAAHQLIDERLSIGVEHGRPRRVGGRILIPMYHPAAALHRDGLMHELEKDMQALQQVLRQKLSSPPRGGNSA